MTRAQPRVGRTSEPLRFDLDGGALAFLEPSHDVPLVSLVVALRCGSAVDPPEMAGLSRIAVRMLRRGCEGLNSEQIDFRIDSLGAEMAVDTSPSTVAIHAQVITRNLDALVDLLVRMLRTPTFPENELERLKRESIAEIVEGRDSDRIVAQKAMNRTLFEGHPDGRNAGGTTQSIPRIARGDVLAFYKRFLVQANLVIGFAGDLTAQLAPVLARRLIAGLPRGEPEKDDVPEPTMRPGRRLLLADKPERTQTQMLVGTLGTAADDDDHVALVVANAVFGGTFTSRLMKEIRSKVAGGVTPREVSFIQRYLVRSHAFDVDTAAKRLHQALDVELLALPPDYFSGWVQRVREVTAEAASLAVKNRIHTENLLSVVVGTASQVLDPLRSALPGLTEASVVPFDAE